LLFFPHQFLAATAGVALICGAIPAFCDGIRWTTWIMTGKRGLWIWLALSAGIAAYTTYDPPLDPDPWACVTTRAGERC